MSVKTKVSKKNVYAKQDRADNQRFMLVLLAATVALMALLYFIFA